VTYLNAEMSFDSRAGAFQSSVGQGAATPLPPSYASWLAMTRPGLGVAGVAVEDRTVQLLQLSSCSSGLWPISPQGRRRLLESLNDTVARNATFDVHMVLGVTRESGTANSGNLQSLTTTWSGDSTTAAQLFDVINATDSTERPPVPLLGFYSPFIMNQASNVAFFGDTAGPGQRGRDAVDCSLVLRSEPNAECDGGVVRYWCMKCAPLFSRGNVPNSSYPEWECLTNGIGCAQYDYEAHPVTPDVSQFVPMSFVTVSDRVPTRLNLIPNVGILALYTTFVLAVGTMLRGAFGGAVKNPPIDDIGDPQSILNHITLMEIARTAEPPEFGVELRTYLCLIDFLRSPEKLLAVGGHRAENIPEKKEQ